MSESGKKVLIIAPTQKWGLLEKNIIQDALSLPYDVTLFLSRDSFIDVKAKELGLSCVYFRGGISGSFDLRLYRELKKILSTYQFDIIYCAHMKSLWPISFLLRNDVKTVLVISSTQIFKRFFHNPFMKWLCSRVDKFFVPSKEHRDNVLTHFKINEQKVISTGMGFEKKDIKELKVDEEFSVSVFVGNHEKDIDRFNVLFFAIPDFNEQLMKKGKKLKLSFVTEKPWNTHLLFGPLQEKSVLYGLGDFIHFAYIGNDDMSGTNLWIDLGKDESLSSLYIQSLCQGVPVILARRPYIIAPLKDDHSFGETFKMDDARDLRTKCLKIYGNYSVYQKGAMKIATLLSVVNDRQFYENILFDELEAACKRRQAYVQRRQKALR